MTCPTTPNPPRGVPARPIHERQLGEDMLRLQRAAAASHQRGQLIEAVRTSMAVLLALAGVAATLTGFGRPVLAIVGLAWFLVAVFLLRNWAASTARQGALLQEMFDTALFHLPWHPTIAGDPVPAPDIHRLVRKLQPGSAKDQRIVNGWYDPTGGVHHPYDVLIAQEQNLAWDTRLRRRYSGAVVSAAVVWSVLGLTIGMTVANASIAEVLLGFFVPSLAAYQMAHDVWIGQQRVATEREQLIKTVTTELRRARPGPITDTEYQRLQSVARDIQGGILRTRLDPTRVPEWFYRKFRTADERDFADTAEGHRQRLAE
ncbi:S-4TM family putative pore-forming effector [Haloechinothrix salitolerans]|uniref:S-4TM family putative pore-forming effector n=1 Tax=Haloechinothrix salitolerans TaxID=926830 RepID=A0ABW2C6M9_9PSEU